MGKFKKEKRKQMYQLWLNDFEGWADNQRANCERMIEVSRSKWEETVKKIRETEELDVQMKLAIDNSD